MIPGEYQLAEGDIIANALLVVRKPFTASIIKLMANYKVGQDGINNFKSSICSNLWSNHWR